MSFWIRTKDKDGTSKARAINTSSPGILIVVATLAVTAVVIANTPMCYPRARTKATDHSRLTGLNDMFRAYDQVHGSKPHSLADLVPKYVTEEFLISPTNQLPYEYYDPPLKVGYYEVMIVRQLNRTVPSARHNWQAESG